MLAHDLGWKAMAFVEGEMLSCAYYPVACNSHGVNLTKSL